MNMLENNTNITKI